MQSSNLANRLKSYWRKEGFGKITKNNIISIILLIPRWLGWAQNQHPPCPYWADLCSCHFLFGYSQLVVQDTDACPPRAHLAATHFFSNCSITASKSSYSFVLFVFLGLCFLLLSPWSCSTQLPELKVLKTFLKETLLHGTQKLNHPFINEWSDTLSPVPSSTKTLTGPADHIVQGGNVLSYPPLRN